MQDAKPAVTPERSRVIGSRIPYARLHLPVVGLLALVLLVGPASARGTAVPSKAGAERGAALAWSGKKFRTAAALRRHVVRTGRTWEGFLRGNPGVVRAFRLERVRWAGRTFHSSAGLARVIAARGGSYSRWARRHPVAAAKLRRNARAVYGGPERPASAATKPGLPAPGPPPAPGGPSATPQLGLAAGGTLPWHSSTDLARELDDYVALGARWIRFPVSWSAIERTRGAFDWAGHDRVVDAARARGIDVLAQVVFTPEWARSAAGDYTVAPADPAEYARFARQVVERYSPRGVKHYELWNEPNLVNFWKPAPDAARYAALVKAAYPQMKAADPAITVMIGATSPVGGYDDPLCNGGSDNGESQNVNPVTFLERLYANGVKGSFDALSHHPYERGGPRSTHVCSAWYQMFGTSPSLRSLMERNGDGAKKLWATEYGTSLEWVDAETQAARLTDSFDLWRAYPWAGALMYYSYRDVGCCQGFHLVNSDWTQRPAWFAFRSAAGG